MVVVIKSSRIEGLEQLNVMPTWCTTAMWRKQYPKNSGIRADFDIRGLKAKYEPDHNLRYCPKLAAPRKAGRPKNKKRLKSPLEGGKGKKKPSNDVTTTEHEEVDNMGERV